MVAQKIQEQKLAKAKSDMVGALQGLFKDIYMCLNDETKLHERLTPQILDFEKQVAAARHQLDDKRNYLSECADMRRRLSIFWTTDGRDEPKADSSTKKSWFSFLRH